VDGRIGELQQGRGGSRDVTELVRAEVAVAPDSDDDEFERRASGGRSRYHSAELPPADDEVVEPPNLGGDPRGFPRSLGGRERPDESEQGDSLNPPGPQDDRKVEPPLWRKPAPLHPASTRVLHLREDHSPLSRAS